MRKVNEKKRKLQDEVDQVDQQVSDAQVSNVEQTKRVRRSNENNKKGASAETVRAHFLEDDNFVEMDVEGIQDLQSEFPSPSKDELEEGEMVEDSQNNNATVSNAERGQMSTEQL